MKGVCHWFLLLLMLSLPLCHGVVPVAAGAGDPLYLELVSTIDLEGEPCSIAVDERTDRVYVGMNRSVAVIDGGTDTVVASFPLDFVAEILEVNRETGHIFVTSHAAGETLVLDGSTGSLVHAFDDDMIRPDEIAIDPVANLVYLAEWTVWLGEYDRVRVVDGSTFEEVGVINVPGSDEYHYVSSVGVEVNPAANLVYMLWGANDTLHVVNGSTREVLAVEPVPGYNEFHINPATGYVYYGDSVLDGLSLEEVPADYPGYFMGADPALNVVYTQSLNTLYALDGCSHEAIDSLELELFTVLEEMAVNSETGKIYMTRAEYQEWQVLVFQCAEDESPPSLAITSPQDGSFIGSDEVEVRWASTDDGSGVGFFEVRLDGGAWSMAGNVTSYVLEGVAEGYHTVLVRAYDAAGNAVEEAAGFAVDLTPPVVSIVLPVEAVLKESTVNVFWEGSDCLSGIDHYTVRIDSGSEVYKGLDTSHNFAGLGDREHGVTVKAVDKAGREGYAFKSFTVDTSLFGMPGWMDEIAVFGVLIALILVVGYLLVRRKRGH